MRKKYFRQLTENRRCFIIHNDLDGLLSWLFLEKFGFRLGGVYDNRTLYLVEGVSLEDCFGVDLDLFLPGVPTLGHHFTLFSHENHVNPNVIFGVTDVEQYQNLNDFMYPPRYCYKCPLPTILLLYWLTGDPIPSHSEGSVWLLYTDSLFRSYGKYKHNVAAWLKELGLQDLLENLSSKRLMDSVSQCAEKISLLENRLSGRGVKMSEKRPFPQCSFKPLELPLLTPFIRDLQQTLQIEHRIIIPDDLTTAFEGYSYEFYLNDKVHHALRVKSLNEEMISHGVTCQTTVKCTFFHELDSVSDDELLRSRTPNCLRKSIQQGL